MARLILERHLAYSQYAGNPRKFTKLYTGALVCSVLWLILGAEHEQFVSEFGLASWYKLIPSFTLLPKCDFNFCFIFKNIWTSFGIKCCLKH